MQSVSLLSTARGSEALRRLALLLFHRQSEIDAARCLVNRNRAIRSSILIILRGGGLLIAALLHIRLTVLEIE